MPKSASAARYRPFGSMSHHNAFPRKAGRRSVVMRGVSFASFCERPGRLREDHRPRPPAIRARVGRGDPTRKVSLARGRTRFGRS
jgi:hypothetical protein